MTPRALERESSTADEWFLITRGNEKLMLSDVCGHPNTAENTRARTSHHSRSHARAQPPPCRRFMKGLRITHLLRLVRLLLWNDNNPHHTRARTRCHHAALLRPQTDPQILWLRHDASLRETKPGWKISVRRRRAWLQVRHESVSTRTVTHLYVSVYIQRARACESCTRQVLTAASFCPFVHLRKITKITTTRASVMMWSLSQCTAAPSYKL